jgi:hypothetical protein
VVELTRGLEVERVRANLEAVRAEVGAAAELVGRDVGEVEILAAGKYVACGEMGVLAQAGIGLVGENRVQDLVEKAEVYGETFTWDFIGRVQSKHVRRIVPYVRLIHSLASESALAELERHAERAREGLRVLVEVNLAGDPRKEGVAPRDLDDFIARSPVGVAGLMTMPPLAADPEESRPWFRRLRELGRERGLEELSMGTTQDFAVAVQEGATIVRIGTRLYA